MKIALNAHLLSAQAGYRSAGIHGYIYNTLQHLPAVADPNWEFHTLVGEGNPPQDPQLIVHRSRFSTASPARRILWEQLIQPSVLTGLKPDVYHGMAFVAPLIMPYPSVITVYDLSFIRYPHALSHSRRLYLQTFTRQSCQRAARVIAISESTARDLTELLDIPHEKIRVAVPGVGEEFQPIDSAEVEAFRQHSKLPKRFILHLGTLEPRKNLPMLLRAYAALPENLQNEVHVVLAGGKGWDYQAVFETITRYNLADKVHLPGYIASEDLPLWYNAADVLVYPSLYEGWGLPVSEAMACGCPTLVSDVSSLPEAAGNTGYRLPPDDEMAWRDALSQALSDETWRQTSHDAGLERAKLFSWRNTAKATLQAYQETLLK